MRWLIDPKHSSLTFAVRHMMVSTVRGSLTVVQGVVELDPGAPRGATIAITADAASVNTGEAARDGHLRSSDFFDAETYPTIAFRSTAVEPTADGGLAVSGELTVRGITKPVAGRAAIEGVWDDPKLGKRVGINGSLTIDRREWGLVWNQPLANSGILVGEKVRIELELAAVAEAVTQAA